MIEWFKHDVHCLQDDRLFALVSRFGMEGYAVFFHAIESMYANNGEPLSEISVRRIAFDFGTTIDKVQEILSYAASESCDFLLLNDGSGFTSERVLDECGKHSERVSKMQSLANKRWDAERNATRITEGNTERNADKIREDKTRKEYMSVSKETSIGEHETCPPEGNEENTDLFGDKVEGKRDSVPVREIVEYWNEKVKSTALPQVTKLTNERRTAIKQRWNEYKDDIYKVIDKTVASDFLTGRDGKWQMCDFDWVFQKKNTLKIIEGKYDEKGIKVSSKYIGNNKSFRPRDINGQYDNEELEELTEL